VGISYNNYSKVMNYILGAYLLKYPDHMIHDRGKTLRSSIDQCCHRHVRKNGRTL